MGSVATAIALAAARSRPPGRRDPTFPVEDVASRHVSILGTLAGFAVTAIVLLVTQSRNLPGASDPSFTTVLGLPAYASMTLLPIAAARPRGAAALARHWHLAVLGYAQAATVLVGFVLLAVLGLA